MARYGSMVLLAKRETTYGTDSVPTNTADAMLLQDVDWTPLEGDAVDRPMVLPHYGNDPFSIVARRARLQGRVDLAGSGALGTVPGYGPLLRGCAMAEAVTASTRVDYTPVSAAEDSLTLYHFLDGTRQVGTGARGDWGLELEAGRIPTLTFDYQALYLAPTAVALPTPTLTAFQAPLPAAQGNTATAQIGANNVVLRRLSYQHGNRLVMRDLPNQRSIRVTGRQPRLTMEIEAPDAVSPDLFALVGTLVAVTVVHGTAAGNTVELQCGQARLMPNPRYVNADNVAHLTLEFRPEPTLAGNNEVLLRVR